MDEETSSLGLTINWTKTKNSGIIRLPSRPLYTIPVNNEHVEVVDDFDYLDARISSSCLSEREIVRRLGLARKTFGRLSRV